MTAANSDDMFAVIPKSFAAYAALLPSLQTVGGGNGVERPAPRAYTRCPRLGLLPFPASRRGHRPAP